MINRYLKKLLVTNLVLITVIAVLQLTILPAQFAQFSWFCLVFFDVAGTAIFALTRRGVLHSSPHRFMAFISGAFLLKFALCILGIIGYVLVIKPKSILIIVPFFIFYVIFTVLEISELLSLLKGLKTKQGQ